MATAFAGNDEWKGYELVNTWSWILCHNLRFPWRYESYDDGLRYQGPFVTHNQISIQIN